MLDAAKFWDNAAEKYARAKIADEAAYHFTLDRTRSYLKPGDKVLEVGCGTGSTALLLAPAVAHITGTDISPNMVSIARGKATADGVTNADFITADIIEITPPQKPYDAVLAHNMLHLLEDVPAAVAHIARLLKPGGIFISKTVCQFGKSTPLKWRLLKLILPIMQWLGKAPYVRFMAVTELEDIIKGAGFELVESAFHPKTAMSRYIVARKV